MGRNYPEKYPEKLNVTQIKVINITKMNPRISRLELAKELNLSDIVLSCIFYTTIGWKAGRLSALAPYNFFPKKAGFPQSFVEFLISIQK